MTKSEFAALLGIHSNSAENINIECAIDLMRSVLSALMRDLQDPCLDIRGSTVLEWNESSVLLQDSGGKLYRIRSDGDGDLTLSSDSSSVFNLLSVEGSLDKIFDSAAVAELQRLQAEVVAERRAKGIDAERAELKRLKLKYEGVSND